MLHSSGERKRKRLNWRAAEDEQTWCRENGERNDIDFGRHDAIKYIYPVSGRVTRFGYRHGRRLHLFPYVNRRFYCAKN